MKLMILDGNSVINRAFYGIRPLTTRDGLPTNAIFGFLNILHRVEAEESPRSALRVAFDLKAPTFRHKQYDGYKATRHAMPEELAQQMPVMKEVLQALRIPIFECEGWEADDVIGTVARVAPRRRGTALSSPATATACSWWATGSRSSSLSPRAGRRLRRITRRSCSRRSMALRRRS